MKLALALVEFFGFEVKPSKVEGPARRMVILGADVDLEAETMALDQSKAAKYREQIRGLGCKRTTGVDNFLSVACKLAYAARFKPEGRPFLTSCYTALRQAVRKRNKSLT